MSVHYSLMNVHTSRSRRQGIGRQYPRGSRSVIRMRIGPFQLSDLASELMQKLSSDINKSKRELFLKGAFAD